MKFLHVGCGLAGLLIPLIPVIALMSGHTVKITLRLALLAGTNFSVLVVCCIWQVFILAILR